MSFKKHDLARKVNCVKNVPHFFKKQKKIGNRYCNGFLNSIFIKNITFDKNGREITAGDHLQIISNH